MVSRLHWNLLVFLNYIICFNFCSSKGTGGKSIVNGKINTNSEFGVSRSNSSKDSKNSISSKRSDGSMGIVNSGGGKAEHLSLVFILLS